MGPTDDANSEVEIGISTPVPTPAPTADPKDSPDPTAASDPTAISESPTAPTTAPEPETASPEPTFAPQPTVAPEPTPEATPDPVIASTVTIPAGTTGEGGEWNLLQEKVQAWINDNQLSVLWQQVKLPAQILVALILLILVLQVYGGIIRTISAVPLAPGLLELAGVVAVANFSVRRLVKSSERKKVLQTVQDRWGQFVGR
tara:strand:- start:1310 stop:1915 length:606 start_codon:yes stop_codon:yes gene_type:complete